MIGRNHLLLRTGRRNEQGNTPPSCFTTKEGGTIGSGILYNKNKG